jgi:hypothetical protein
MKNLLISGNTLQEWNIQEILRPELTKQQQIDRMLDYEWDNTIGKYCDGMTYLEIEQFNNTYNNFR